MSNSWREAYSRLQDFITANPGIEIRNDITVILGDVRPEFYRLFDDIRITLLKEKCAALIKEAEILSDNYIKVEEEVTKLLKLENISLTVPLQMFLHNPINALIKDLWGPLFDLLKGRIDQEFFERKGIRNVEITSRGLVRLGYAKWVALSLVKLLVPDKLFDIAPPDSFLSGHGTPKHLEKPVPIPEETKNLSFEYGPNLFPPFITPNFILHSTRLNRYVSIRTELWARAEYSAIDASEKREWLSLDTLSEEYRLAQPNPSLLIYIDDKPEELALIVDKKRICRPDLIVELREPEDWDEKDELAQKTKFFDILKPGLGRYVVSRGPAPEQISEEPAMERVSKGLMPEQQGPEKQGAVTAVLTVGFDQSRLGPIVETISHSDRHDFEGKDELIHKGGN